MNMTKEEAIRRIKAWKLDPDDMEVLSAVIPELVESEDERIRKALVDFLDSVLGKDLLQRKCGQNPDAVLAYLEKQKHSLNFDVISSWLRDHANNYVNGEFNKFHHCVDYDGTINVERLIADLKAAVDSGTFDVYEQKDQNLEDIEDKAVRKYMKLDKFALANMLAERDKTNAEVIEAFKSIEEQPAESSEDERIRKVLIHIVKGACDTYGIKYKGDDITEEKLLAYLEKQK